MLHSQKARYKGFNQLTLSIPEIHHVCLQLIPCWPIEMYWAKCKQSKFHTGLAMLCSHFLCLKVIRPWHNMSTSGHGHVIWMLAIKDSLRKLARKLAYCQAAWEAATPLLPFWTHYMSWAHSIPTPCTCVNNTSCKQPKVVPEPEILAPRGK